LDIKEYIASGIIDSYVLGSVSDQEWREVQCLSHIYPEIAEELKAAQLAMEEYALSLSVPAPASARASILAKISETPQDQPATSAKDEVKQASQELQREKVQVTRVLFPQRAVAAASIALFIVTGSLFLLEYNKANSLEVQLADLEVSREKETLNFDEQLNTLQANLTSIAEREQIITASGTRELIMQGTPQQPSAVAKIFWDASGNQLLLSSDGLPVPVSGKQYQLWAIADGVPVSLGVLDKDKAFSNPIAVNLEGIQAFAITLEKDGGVASPTMEQMYVIVSV